MVAAGGFGQIFITDTDRDRLSPILEATGQDYRLMTVKAGVISL
jgi:hypothetical protein